MTADLDVLIIGGGITGLAQTVALAQAGLDVACVDPQPAATDTGVPLDGRTTALLQGSVALLERLGVWSACRPSAGVLGVMRIVDEAGRPRDRPLTARFDSAELDSGPFGYNVPNAVLRRALLARLAELPSGRHLPERTAEAIRFDTDHAAVDLSDERTLTARLLVGADGKHSPTRASAGLRARKWGYGQTAMAFSIAHTRAHDDVSVEFHRTSGPFVLVPLPGNESSVVWVDRDRAASRFLDLEDGAFRRAVQTRTRGVLGQVTAVGRRWSYPAMSLIAERYTAPRVALIGEAAHATPPIGAQGLNLGLTDVAVLTEALTDARAAGTDIGDHAAVLRGYERARRPDVVARVAAIDALNWAVMSSAPPVQMLRHLGLSVTNRADWLKTALMRRGLAPLGATPALMRPAAPGADAHAAAQPAAS
jgi:2-octaprenyl-6-methoxyphenol hydroxylase